MNKYTILSLKVLRALYSKIKGNNSPQEKPPCETNVNNVSELIFNLLSDDESRMIARFGSTEMLCIKNYMGVKSSRKSYLDFIFRNGKKWWWETNIMNQMQNWSGFFPSDIKHIEHFCELMIEDIDQVDILGSWLPDEKIFENELKSVVKVNLELLNPYFSDIPWTRALENKKILVVHPFAETIERQYKKRHLLFENNLLPEFELKTIKAVQSIAGTKTPFKSWFEALDFMKREIDKVDYDICLIGCGAYGFPLAAHVKRSGKKGFHVGGSLQLLFGIKGKRWENPSYNEKYNYSKLINDHWVYPDNTDKPTDANSVEGACYW